jgi:hypothetical protein
MPDAYQYEIFETADLVEPTLPRGYRTSSALGLWMPSTLASISECDARCATFADYSWELGRSAMQDCWADPVFRLRADGAWAGDHLWPMGVINMVKRRTKTHK